MRVIHGIWAHGALCLWAEDPELPPTAGGGPLASPELVRPARDEPVAAGGSAGPVRRGRVSLASWRVPVLAFGPAAALTVLAALGGSGQPDDPATAGGSLAYLAAVA